MSAHSRVIWSEGLFLQPQHFQQQERYLERYVESRCQSLIPHSWGFTAIEFERDLLSIGKVALRRATGVFPDGTPFQLPDDDPLPPPIDIDASVHDEIVNLAIPLRRAGEIEVAREADGNGLMRHGIGEVQARNAASDAGDPAVLEVGVLRTRLLLDREATQAYACVPLAQVVECRADKVVVPATRSCRRRCTFARPPGWRRLPGSFRACCTSAVKRWPGS
jgi:type VI secretion system protein ImpJ